MSSCFVCVFLYRNTGMYLGVYAALGFGQGIIVLLGSFILALASVKAGRRLHRDMLRNILRSPMVRCYCCCCHYCC